MFVCIIILLNFWQSAQSCHPRIRFKDHPPVSKKSGMEVVRQLCNQSISENGIVKVYGTTYYSEDSSVCDAAVHAGVLKIDGIGNVSAQVHILPTIRSIGSIRNRKISHGVENRTGLKFFKFITEEIEQKLNPNKTLDVYLIHGFYTSTEKLSATCLYENPLKVKPEFLNRNFRNVWNNQLQPKREDGKFNRVSMTVDFLNSDAVLRCLGSNFISDVAGVPLNREEAVVIQTTYVGVLNGSLKIRLNRNCDETYFMEKMEEADWTDAPYEIDSELQFPSLQKHHEGIYLIRGYGSPYRHGRNAYINIMVKECSDDSYGPKCSSKCSCENGGQCHPKNGVCLCRPGFNGSKCETECAADHFGTKCQFSCTSTLLGENLGDSSGSCQGLVFCLPFPYGCSCAAGYSGPLCDNRENLPAVTCTRGLPYSVMSGFLIFSCLMIILLVCYCMWIKKGRFCNGPSGIGKGSRKQSKSLEENQGETELFPNGEYEEPTSLVANDWENGDDESPYEQPPPWKNANEGADESPYEQPPPRKNANEKIDNHYEDAETVNGESTKQDQYSNVIFSDEKTERKSDDYNRVNFSPKNVPKETEAREFHSAFSGYHDVKFNVL